MDKIWDIYTLPLGFKLRTVSVCCLHVIFDVVFTMCSLYFFRNHLEENHRLQRETPEVAHCDERVRKLWRRRQIKALAAMAGRLHCSHRNSTLGSSNKFLHWYYFGPAFAISAFDNVKRHNDCFFF